MGGGFHAQFSFKILFCGKALTETTKATSLTDVQISVVTEACIKCTITTVLLYAYVKSIFLCTAMQR